MSSPTLAEFTLEVSRAAFLRAKSFKITKAVGLSVYRSVWLHETDDWYKPIEKALGMYPHREVHREVRVDPSMMFGKAEHTLYALGETDEEAKHGATVLRAVRLIFDEIA
jgi:hypothetical protein